MSETIKEQNIELLMLMEKNENVEKLEAKVK